MKPTVLTIAGSDSSGGAGIQADIRTISALGAWPATVVTAVTAQDASGVVASRPVDVDLVRTQLRTALGGLDVTAAKTGMLATASIVREVAAALREHRPGHVVCDPILAAGSGAALLEEDAVDVLRTELLPAVSLVTPNVPEAERLAGVEIRSTADAQRAGHRLVELGAGAALVTGGHLPDAPGTDVLVTPEETRVFPGEWIESPPVHGTGCVTSAALATLLALGASIPDAVTRTRAFVREAIGRAQDHGAGFVSADPAGSAGASSPTAEDPTGPAR